MNWVMWSKTIRLNPTKRDLDFIKKGDNRFLIPGKCRNAHMTITKSGWTIKVPDLDVYIHVPSQEKSMLIAHIAAFSLLDFNLEDL